jgi:DNA-directed RNA polymerase specialized sigma24 family protein
MTASPADGRLLSRHEADLATVERVRLVGFRGPIFEWFFADLYRYAWPVMLHAIRTGTIVSIETGIPHGTISMEERQLLHDSSPEREDLALASIARALPKFIRSLRLGMWDPSKGRSLRSFFICACARAFWREYALWSAQRRRHLRAIASLAEGKSTDDELVESFDEHHERRQAVELLLARAARRSPELEAILQCLLSGMTAAETASRLGYTERAVEGRLYQFRKTAWGLVRSGRIDPSLVPGSRARLARERAGADW